MIDERLPALAVQRAAVLDGSVRIVGAGEVLPALGERRCKNLGVPTVASAHVDDGHGRLDAEELERLERVAVLVAFGVARLAMLAGDRGLDGSLPARVRLFRQRLRLGADRGGPSSGLGLAILFPLGAVFAKLTRVFGLLLLLGGRLGDGHRSGRGARVPHRGGRGHGRHRRRSGRFGATAASSKDERKSDETMCVFHAEK